MGLKCDGTLHPFTVVVYIDFAVRHIHTWASTPDTAVIHALEDYFYGRDWMRADVQMLCCLYGHNEMCMLEWSERWEWMS